VFSAPTTGTPARPAGDDAQPRTSAADLGFEPPPAAASSAPPEPAGDAVAISATNRRSSIVVPTDGSGGGGMSPAVKVLAVLLALTACAVAVGRRLGFAGAAGAGQAGTVTRAGLPAGGGRLSGPATERVGHRLVVLVAVAMRALSKCGGRDVHEDDDVSAWARAGADDDEVDDLEDAILARPPDALHAQLVAHGTWQIEGAVVLAWALGLIDELPPYDEPADPSLVASTVAFPDAEATAALLRSATRRDQAQIDARTKRLLSIHWRLKDFAATGEALDLASYGRSNPDGPLRFDGVPLVDDDMAVAGRSISDADPESVEVAASITAERLRALRWLSEGGRYSAITVD
jgi:hypothetical protein